ncbi:MAG: transposase [Deltaproteobacteria bacterium]|nr:transposase [Deltaproteobacteria bacterium]
MAIQTFGDFLGYNPHAHIVVTDGCHYDNGMFRVSPLWIISFIKEHQIIRDILDHLAGQVKTAAKNP